MANNFKEGALGSIRFSAPVFSFGTTAPAVNSGFNFDLPIASVQSMANNSLTFMSNNSNANRGFMSNVIKTSNAGVSAASSKAFTYQNNALKSLDKNSLLGFMSINNLSLALEKVVKPKFSTQYMG